MASFRDRRKAIKNDAAKVLFSEFSYYLRTGFFVLLVISGVSNLCGILVQNLSLFSDRTVFFGTTVYYILTALVLSPYAFKFFKRPDFLFFNDVSYTDSLKITVFSVLCILLKTCSIYYLPKFAGYMIRKISFQNGLVDSVSAFLICIVGFVLVFAVCIYLNGFFVLPFLKPDILFFNRLKQSIKLMKGKKCEAFFFELSFIPLFLSVYFTFGITFVFVLPHYLLSLCIFARYIVEDGKDAPVIIIR